MAVASFLKKKLPCAASVQELGVLPLRGFINGFVGTLPLPIFRACAMAGDRAVATSAHPTLSPTSSPSGVQRNLLKEGCAFGLPWHQKMSRSISIVRAPLLSPPSTEGKEQPVPSPLTMVPTPSDPSKKSSAEIDRKRPVQAVLKKIKESPKKVNLVAALVRGMQVQDALLQLAVLQKRAAKTVKRVVANARANATHNHGLNGDRLFVAEAFVGKGKYLKRLSYHAKGRSGIMHHPSCRLTVIVKELSDEQEAEIARYKTMTFRERAKVKTRLIPHTLIETTPHWHRTSPLHALQAQP